MIVASSICRWIRWAPTSSSRRGCSCVASPTARPSPTASRRRLGDVRKSRAVGAANGRNPISIIVPCHRVVGANGALTGFAAGLEAKAWLLRHEQGTLTLLD